MNTSLAEAILDTEIQEPNQVQTATFSTIKSGAHCLIVSPEQSGKTSLLVMSIIQCLDKATEQSPRALVMVSSRNDVSDVVNLFKILGKNTDLRVFGVHDKGDMDYDKNYISDGLDVLVGTPNKLNDLLSSAGYDVNRLKMFVVDDLDKVVKDRFEAKILRICSITPKAQKVFLSTVNTSKIENLIDKILSNPFVYNA